MDEANARGIDNLYLHAQTQAIGFYEKEGFTAEGDEFLECDIAHRKMSQTR
jgi:predicted GNAT family N-acyltransferase